MAQPKSRKLVLQSDLAEAHRIEQTILDDLRGCGFDEDDLFAIRLALDEALTNAIKHGNGNDPAKRVHIEYSADADRARISVCDEGPGFTPDAVPDPRLDENLDKPNGRGLMLISAYMNEVAYNDRGNCVTMVKRRGVKPGLS